MHRFGYKKSIFKKVELLSTIYCYFICYNVLIRMRAEDIITEANFDYLAPDKSCKEARFYLLPKIHKTGSVPGRPVVSTNSHPTKRISEFVDAHIKDYVQEIPTYIWDTTHLIQLLNEVGKVPKDAIIFTMDVTALYSNVPNHEGTLAVANKLRNDPSKRVLTKWILELMTLVLHKTNIGFNGEHYIQTSGISMGCDFSPSMANIFMDRLEKEALSTAPFKPLWFKRYIDDCLGIWTHGLDKFKEFVNHMNQQHPMISFTYEYSTDHVNFLDTQVCIDKVTDTIYTRLYTKPTDTHSYLHATSCHHTPSITKGPYGQFLRIRRICKNSLISGKK